MRGTFRTLIRQFQKQEPDKIVPVKRGSAARKKTVAGTAGKRTKLKRNQSVPLKGVVSGKRIYGTFKGKEHTAVVLRSGRIRLKGQLYTSPSGAASAIRGKATNGWAFWKIRQDGELVPLSTLRQ